MPAKAPGETYFTVWESDRAGWSLARAYYSHRIGSDLELCEVVAVVDQNAPVTVLRKLPLKKTDVDVPGVTEWTPLDLADTRGTGQLDVISGRRCLREPLARSHQRATMVLPGQFFLALAITCRISSLTFDLPHPPMLR